MIELAIAGGIGGFVKSLLENKGRVALPSIETVLDNTLHITNKYVHLGFISNIILGTTIAYFTTTDLVGAFSTGMASAFLIEKSIEITNPKL